MPLAEASRTRPETDRSMGTIQTPGSSGSGFRASAKLQPSGEGGRDLGFGVAANGNFPGIASVVRLFRRPVASPKRLGRYDVAVLRSALLRRAQEDLPVRDLERDPPLGHGDGRGCTLGWIVARIGQLVL